MSSDWSFGNRSSPCSQSRKISIGIMVDSLKKGTDCSRKYETEATTLSELNSKLGDGARTKLQHEEGSPWVKPRSNCKKSLVSEGDSRRKGDRRRRDETSSKLPPPDEPIKFYSRNASIFKSKSTGTGKKRPNCQKNGEINQNTGTIEKQFSPLYQEVPTADAVPAEDRICSTVNERSENLRMKLCELMGNVFSPEKNQTSLPPMDAGITPLKPEPNILQANNVSLPRKPNSDTTETDSENPGGSKRRPVSRSIMRKRGKKKAPPEKIERIPRSNCKDDLKESNVYLFGEDCKVAQSSACRKGSSTFKPKNSIPTTSTKSKETKRKFTWNEPRIISFPVEENGNKIQEEACRKENPFSVGRPSTLGVRLQNSSSLTLEEVGKNARARAVESQRDPLEQLLERKLDGGNTINISKLTENVASGNHLGTIPAFKSSVDQQDYFASPTIGSRTPLMSSSLDSSCKDDQTKQGNPSVAEAMFNLESMLAHGNFFTSKDAHTKQREKPGVGNDDCDSEDSSDSDSSKEGDMDSSGKDPGEEVTLSPELVTVNKPNSLLHRPKRLRSLRDTTPYVHQHVTRASKGKGKKTNAVKQDSGEVQVQDEFSRAIGPLAMSLEKIKNKVKLVTANKSSEILNSLAAKIQAHMQSAESQIQLDMGKLKNFSKQKRKFLEREFQEQEKQLRSIHGRFKNELSQHVQHCIETTEGLDENKKEFKKILEKRKASHKKLLMQVEQAAQTEIHDAEKRLSNMNKLAREQLLELRLLIEQYLGEGVMC
ncbi:hypothetical protein MLD38_033462 [Melastoma candidum]|uniref:Uncharacterized protein n=1 Tax=Melastoma candidum TaxID=119954 RepID=A0ACB9M936_9MYRT|nr:hypothetical protein MLD38_033462 [Melastoma candidum]